MKLILRWLINTVAIWIAIELVPGIVFDGAWHELFVISLVFGLLNALVRPILKLLTCPLILLTLGLFVLVLNALMFGLTAWLVDPLTIDGVIPAFIGALVVSIVSGVISMILIDDKK